MNIEQESLGNATLLKLKGNLDSFSVGALKERMDGQLESGVHNFIMDLTEVDFMDSAGLGQLVGALKKSAPHGGDVILVGPNKTIRDLLRMTRLDSIFKCVDNVTEAQKEIGTDS